MQGDLLRFVVVNLLLYYYYFWQALQVLHFLMKNMFIQVCYYLN